VFGLCFSLGYGLTQRLGRLGSTSAAKGEVPAFAAQESPGTRLGELQKRFGAEGKSLVGDLDRLVEERRQEGQRGTQQAGDDRDEPGGSVASPGVHGARS
jgi:hypothetical protein